MPRVTPWIGWTRTLLTPSQVDVELGRLSACKRARLEDDHRGWIPGRALWLDPRRVHRVSEGPNCA